MSSQHQSRGIWLYAWFVCLIAAVFYCYEYLLRITPSVMTVELREAFGGLSYVALGHLSAYYYYAYTPMQLPVGILMDRYGPRYLLTLACLTCCLGAYMFATTDEFWVAAAGRFLMGFGSAFAFVGVMTLASIWLPPQNFAMIAGMATTLGMVGAMQGEVILAVLVDEIGWRQTLVISAYVGVALTLVILLLVRDRSPRALRPFSPQEANFADLFRGLIHLLKKSQIWVIGSIGALLFLSLSAFAELWGASYFQTAYAMTRVEAAQAVGMVFLGWAVGGPIVGFISDRMKSRVLPIRVGAVIAGLLAAAFLYLPMNSLTLFTCLFLYGVACSVQVIVFALGRENAPIHMAGISVATVNMVVMIGGVISQPLIGKVLDWLQGERFASAERVFSTNDYQIALVLLPVAATVAALLTFFLKETACELQDQ